MIADLLPRYCEVFDPDTTYIPLRIFTVEGHEVAWMEVAGIMLYDLTGQGRESHPYKFRGLYCECNFTEGTGWEIRGNQRYNLGGPEKCIHRKEALRLRHLELRQEYLEHSVPEIIFALIEKAKAGEFIEDGSGASFWGGYFYLQTVAAITAQPEARIWEEARRLVAERKIGLEGAVVQPYQEPPPPAWE